MTHDEMNSEQVRAGCADFIDKRLMPRALRAELEWNKGIAPAMERRISRRPVIDYTGALAFGFVLGTVALRLYWRHKGLPV